MTPCNPAAVESGHRLPLLGGLRNLAAGEQAGAEEFSSAIVAPQRNHKQGKGKHQPRVSTLALAKILGMARGADHVCQSFLQRSDTTPISSTSMDASHPSMNAPGVISPHNGRRSGIRRSPLSRSTVQCRLVLPFLQNERRRHPYLFAAPGQQTRNIATLNGIGTSTKKC